jgi:hypothetical protein
VRQAITAALLDIDPKKRRQLFKVLFELLRKMQADGVMPGDGLKRLQL